MFKKLLLLLILVYVGNIFAQGKITFTPEKPRVGDLIKVTFDPTSTDSKIKDVNECNMEIMILTKESDAIINEIDLKKDANVWKGEFKLTEPAAALLLVRFVSGKLADNNNDNIWKYLVYNKDGNPVSGAHFQMASAFRANYYDGFTTQRDLDKVNSECLNEIKLYPNNVKAYTLTWSVQQRQKPGDETNAKIKSELQKLYKNVKDNEEAVAGLIGAFDMVGMKDKSEEIKNNALKNNPKGKIAQNLAQQAINKERDPNKRLELAQKFLKDFPDMNKKERENFEDMLIYFSTNAKKYDVALTIPDIEKKPSLLNSLAFSMIKNDQNIEKAIELVKKAINLLRNPDIRDKASDMSKANWKGSNENLLGASLDTYGSGLLKTNKNTEAEEAFSEAVKVSKSEDESINEHLIEAFIKNQKFEEALDWGGKFIVKNKSTEKIEDYLKTAYIKVKGSDRHFTENLLELKEESKKEMKAELLTHLINKPAIDFTLKSMDGKTIKLSDLKGKVVVIDFWATWCGPCKSSFPFLQKVLETYKNNSNVVILALDTWERVAGTERENLVKKFMQDNKYTFTVLYDEDFVTKYGVEGIPTKFIIDKNGMIRFKTVGFDNGQKMLNEMAVELEYLLEK